MLRIFLSIVLVFCLNANESKKDEPKKTQAPAKSLTSVVTHGKVPRRFSSKPAARPKPTAQPVPAVQAYAAPKATPQQQVVKRNVGTVATSKIYIDNKITPKEDNLVVNWFDSSNKILDQVAVPKGSNASLIAPQDANYFNVANNTETLKSGNLRAVNNTVYTLTCAATAGNKCKQLVVTSGAKQVKRSPQASSKTTPGAAASSASKSTSVKTVPVKGGISLVNNTGNAFMLAWLDKKGKRVGTQVLNSNDFINNIQSVSLKPVKNAVQFQLILLGSMFSNIVKIVPDSIYKITCQPDNFNCNKVVVTKQAQKTKK